MMKLREPAASRTDAACQRANVAAARYMVVYGLWSPWIMAVTWTLTPASA